MVLCDPIYILYASSARLPRRNIFDFVSEKVVVVVVVVVLVVLVVVWGGRPGTTHVSSFLASLAL